MQLGQLGSAVSELSQLLSQAIVQPFRRSGRPGAVRTLPRAAGGGRGFSLRLRGTLWLASGAMPDDLLVDLIHEAGGRRARAVILPAAAYAFAEAGERYRRYLRRFGMERAETLGLSTRQQAEDPALAAAIAGADLVALGGGQPELLLDIMAGSAAAAALLQGLQRGAAVAVFGPAVEGTGEWALSPAGTPASGAPTGLRRALGLLPGTLVGSAPHGAGRLAATFGAALAASAQALLLDERTTLAVRPGWQVEVRSGAVLAVGAPPAEPGEAHGPVAAAAPLGGVWTRVAPAGWRLDLAAGAVLPPGAAAVEPPR